MATCSILSSDAGGKGIVSSGLINHHAALRVDVRWAATAPAWFPFTTLVLDALPPRMEDPEGSEAHLRRTAKRGAQD
ncbi:MAG: hypothetical protein M3O36_21395, partial [Myxococcota bacterium]|nr:hypothetical protein [Myxococcota bacterium]